MFPFLASLGGPKIMWWKIIIFGQTGPKPSYKLWCSEDDTLTQLHPIQKNNYQEAFEYAQRKATRYHEKYNLVEFPRVMVFEVPQPIVKKIDEFEALVQGFLRPYFGTDFYDLINSEFWQRAVGPLGKNPKTEQIGFNLFKTFLKRDLDGWQDFESTHINRAKDLDEILFDQFLSNYYWLIEAKTLGDKYVTTEYEAAVP